MELEGVEPSCFKRFSVVSSTCLFQFNERKLKGVLFPSHLHHPDLEVGPLSSAVYRVQCSLPLVTSVILEGVKLLMEQPLGYRELGDLGIASASQNGIGTTIFNFSEQVFNGVSVYSLPVGLRRDWHPRHATRIALEGETSIAPN